MPSRSLRNSVKKDLFELKLLSISNKITEFKDNIAEYKELLSSNNKYSEFSDPVNKLEDKLNIIISKLEEIKKENNISEIKDHKQIKHKKITKKLKFD